jgi:hypothetical protein
MWSCVITEFFLYTCDFRMLTDLILVHGVSSEVNISVGNTDIVVHEIEWLFLL